MDHKYKSLLQNIPTRHLINEVQSGRIRFQLENFKRLELFNYFIIGELSTIKSALDAGDGLGYFDRKFAWHTISLVRVRHFFYANALFILSKNLLRQREFVFFTRATLFDPTLLKCSKPCPNLHSFPIPVAV